MFYFVNLYGFIADLGLFAILLLVEKWIMRDCEADSCAAMPIGTAVKPPLELLLATFFPAPLVEIFDAGKGRAVVVSCLQELGI